MEKKRPKGKVLAWSYAVVIAFAVVYFVGGILLDKKTAR
jgi:hypothetical protein